MADTQWIPPPHLDHGQARINDYHHPERFFGDEPHGELFDSPIRNRAFTQQKLANAHERRSLL